MSSCFSRCLRVPIAIRAFYESYLWILQTLLLTHPDLHPALLGGPAGMTDATEFKRPRGRWSHKLWQEAVDMSYALLTLDAVRQAHQIAEGPKVNHARCRQILKDGEKRGFRPAPNATENFIRELCRDPESKD